MVGWCWDSGNPGDNYWNLIPAMEGGLVGAGRQLVSCVLVQSLSKYSRVGQLGPDTDRQLTSADTVSSWPGHCRVTPLWYLPIIGNYYQLSTIFREIFAIFEDQCTRAFCMSYVQGVPYYWAHFVFCYFVNFYSTKIQKFSEC